MAHGVIAILGSGETAPGMVKVHRELVNTLDIVRAVTLEAPYGFQENVPQLTDKITEFFKTSLHVDIEPSHYTSFEQSSALQIESLHQLVRDASFVFAGPGSPSYALKQWAPIDLSGDLRHVLAKGGVVCFSSAAALTLGKFTAPIYEIYKVGDPPSWLPGLDVVSEAGLNCVVIPHFDNAEGGNHDTRFCYLGETRLRRLEAMLNDNVATLGVDEHTAAIIDLAADTLSVRGRSAVHWRVGSNQRTLANGSTMPLSELRTTTFAPRPVDDVVVVPRDDSPEHLGEIVQRGGSDATAALAKLVSLAATGGTGYVDPTSIVEGVLATRSNARAAGHYDVADQLRDALVAGGIEIQDTAEGATWSLRPQ